MQSTKYTCIASLMLAHVGVQTMSYLKFDIFHEPYATVLLSMLVYMMIKF